MNLSGPMWANNESIEKAREKLVRYQPPYCANPFCEWHHPQKIDQELPFIRYGTKELGRYPYFSQRFQCKRCRRTFSASYFSLQYRERSPDLYEQVAELLNNGYSGRNVAKLLKVDEDSIRRRRKKLCRWGLLAWAKDLASLKIRESVAYDGLENFSYSQYDPNNLNHAVGRSSYFIYDFNLSPMNRKGRMSPRQQKTKKALEEAYGVYDGRAIEKDSKRIFERLLKNAEGPLKLHSDNHYAYRRALKRMKGRDQIFHHITPAKLGRNFRNRLFAINHTDMLTRHHLGAYKRETIAFAKTTVSMLESFVLLAIHKNYLRPKFTKKQKIDKTANTESPAMALKLREKILSFREFYRTRISVHHVDLNPDWQNLFDSVDPSSRRAIRPYAGI